MLVFSSVVSSVFPFARSVIASIRGINAISHGKRLLTKLPSADAAVLTH